LTPVVSRDSQAGCEEHMSRSKSDAREGTWAFLLIAALGVLVALQGWKTRIPNFDVLTTIDAAKNFLDSWHVPDTGVVTSFGSFTPPGATWLMIPGVLIFRDPRLFEYIGSLGLYLGALCGIFVLARRHLGWRCALLAVALYAFSELGLRASSSVWQRYPIHCFTVWFAYCIVRWVEEDAPVFLGIALLTWAAGMYVFMEMAPAVLAAPVIWLLYRPSVRVAPVLAAIVSALVLWYPYIRYEQVHHLVDVRSQVLRERVQHGPFNASWCDPGVSPAGWQQDVEHAGGAQTSRVSLPRAARLWLSERISVMTSELILANFRGTPPISGVPYILFLLTVSGTAVLFIESLGGRSLETGNPAVLVQRITWLGTALVVTGLILNEQWLARYVAPDGALEPSSIMVIRAFQAVLLTTGVTLILWRNGVATEIRHAMVKWSATGPRASGSVLALVLWVPWVALLMVATAERRLGWLWPLQVIPLAACVTYVPRRLGAPRWATRLGSAVLAGVVLGNPVLLSRVRDWMDHGWSGRDAMEVELTDRIAAMVQSTGFRDASIGYEIEVWQFMATYHDIDPRYKVGADLDLLLRYRHGITNRDHCAEGFSASDQYRVVQSSSRATVPEGRNHIETSRDASFQMADGVGAYEIFQHSWLSNDHHLADHIAGTSDLRWKEIR
jgi:hypothetical protein